MALLGYRWASLVTSSRSESYRQLARDLHLMSRSLPAGKSRSVLLEMAEERNRLADQQERATDLRNGEHHGRRF
jgi:phage terminase Nu1 subunit (DNA packaging protein)